MSVFKLYNFVSNHLAVLREKGFTIDVAHAPREAFYGNIPAVDAVLARKSETGPWVFDSQHITIEKNIDPDNPAMGPHWTLRYRHKKDSTRMCVVHAYFDKKIVLNGFYQQRVIQTAQDGTETVVFSDNYHEGKMQADLPYPGVSLTLYQIKDLAAIGARKFMALNAARAEKYVELYQAIQKKDLEITEILHHKAEGYLEKASAEVDCLRPIIQELNIYTDGKKNYTDILIMKQIQALKRESKRDDKPLTQDVVIEDVTSTEQYETVVRVAQMLPEGESEKESMQAQIKIYIDEVLHMQAENHVDTADFYQRLQVLNTAVVLFELMYDVSEDKNFLREQRARLPETCFNLTECFKQAVLTGNVPVVRAMFYVVELNTDWVLLFSELLEIIEVGENARLCERLIPVVHYLHEHSDLFQAFVLFKMTRLEYPAHQTLSGGELRANLLSMLYCTDNLRAYRLYLELGCSPEGLHARCGQFAFNALQTIALLPNRASNREPYLEALFEHGAVSSITPYILPETYISHTLRDANMASNPATISATLFHHVVGKQSSGRKKGSKLVKQSKPQSTCLAEDMRELDVLMQKENILAWSWTLYQLSEPEVVGLMVGHSDMKTCLLEFSNIVAQANFTVAFIPCTQGGAAFHMSEKSIEKDARKHMNFSDLDNITMFAVSTSNPNQLMHQKPILLAERKTIRSYVTFNPEHRMSVEKQEKLLKSAKLVYQGFERLFDVLSDQEKRCFVDTLMRLAIQSKLAGDPPIETLKLYQAAITAHSLIKQMVINDYQRMIKLFLAYGKMFDEMNGAPTVVPVQICMNLEALLSQAKLNPKMLVALASDLQAVHAVIESDNAGLLGSATLK